MYILAGRLKNQRIVAAYSKKNSLIRPTMARTRAAIFNIVTSLGMFYGKKQPIVADICSGTGAFGIEALSRGASEATFVDNNSSCLKVLHHNLVRCDIYERTIILRLDARYLPFAHNQYDLVYVDPPYYSGILQDVLSCLVLHNWLHKNSIVIVETAKNEEYRIPGRLHLLQQRVYGSSLVSFYTL